MFREPKSHKKTKKSTKKKIKVDKTKLSNIKPILYITILLFLIVMYNVYANSFISYNDKGFEELSNHMHNIYVPNLYDCDDMSKDCEEFFENIGINTYVYVGHNNNSVSSHCWLELELDDQLYEFECTSFRFKHIKRDYDNWIKLEGWINGSEVYEHLFQSTILKEHYDN